jgi:hypothetical protein
MRFLTAITIVKDEPFLAEFVAYHLSEGFDFIHIIDDHSVPPLHIPEAFAARVKVWPVTGPKGAPRAKWRIFSVNELNRVYCLVRSESDWFAVLDADEFFCTRRNPEKTVVQVLQETFRDCDCVKIPWVMMACGGREQDPESLLLEIRHRWNHDLRHPHPQGWHKGRCRYDSIEVKCVFRASAFASIKNPHCPGTPVGDFRCVDGVQARPAALDPFYPSLREEDIFNAHLVCHHYRIISRESCERKARGDVRPYKIDMKTILMGDHAEILDETMLRKWQRHLEGLASGSRFADGGKPWQLGS